jgi:hypothetical protein
VDENRLIAKLRAIEALFAGATTDGERDAAHGAKQRILERLHAMQAEDPKVEFRFKMADAWSRRVFLALLRRYGITPYRLPRQRNTTVMARVPKRFVNETLWPEFEQISSLLRSHLEEITQRLVSEVLHEDSSDPVELVLPDSGAPKT